MEPFEQRTRGEARNRRGRAELVGLPTEMKEVDRSYEAEPEQRSHKVNARRREEPNELEGWSEGHLRSEENPEARTGRRPTRADPEW